MNNFSEIIKEMQKTGMKIPDERVCLKLDNAKEILKNTIEYFLSLEDKKVTWLSQYNDVADWLQDNKGKGLLLYGTCGQGKTVLSKYVIPAIFLNYHRKVVKYYDIQDMNNSVDAILQKKIISLDDIGTEDVYNSFGNKRMTFAEIVDLAEKESKLLIITTNLNAQELKDKYGERIYDRLIAITARVLFTGKSLRK